MRNVWLLSARLLQPQSYGGVEDRIEFAVRLSAAFPVEAPVISCTAGAEVSSASAFSVHRLVFIDLNATATSSLFVSKRTAPSFVVATRMAAGIQLATPGKGFVLKSRHFN